MVNKKQSVVVQETMYYCQAVGSSVAKELFSQFISAISLVT